MMILQGMSCNKYMWNFKSKKVILFLIITGWIRLLFILTPIVLVYFGVQSDVSTPTKQME